VQAEIAPILSPTPYFKIKDFETLYWYILFLDQYITRNTRSPHVATLGTRQVAASCKLWKYIESHCRTEDSHVHTCSIEYATNQNFFELFQRNTQNIYTLNTFTEAS